jgi:UDP-N-acetyl-2-amino-2-deoxyglucuronate dehydrogenase
VGGAAAGCGERLGFGFIGAGEIAVASAEAVRDAHSASLRLVADPRSDLAADLVAHYGGAVAPSVEALLADPAVDAVYICTPHFLHRDLALLAAAAGKHVFVEKPMGVTPDDAAAIVDACETRGVACGVPFVARGMAAYREAHELVRAGTIGAVTGFRVTFRSDKAPVYWRSGLTGRVASDWRQWAAQAGGGVALMNTIHDLDAVLWIAGLEVEHVEAVTANLACPGDVEDLALAIFSCSGGAFGSLEAGTSFPGGTGPGERWVNRLYGSRGQILLPSPWEAGTLALFTRDEGAWRERTFAPTAPGATLADARRLAFQDFAAAVLAGTPVPIPGEDGLKASQIVHALYQAARSGTRAGVTSRWSRTGASRCSGSPRSPSRPSGRRPAGTETG